MIYLPRKPQLAMLAGMHRSPRHQLIASMGLGKSGALLLRASSIEMLTGAWPGMLIAAPLQVCYSWRNEIPRWLPGKRVNLICGSMEQRKAALQTPGDVNLVSYDTLPWLAANGPANWATAFGELMVCDESQRVKSTRVSWQCSPAGRFWLKKDTCGVQNRALAEQAANFPWWVNATGTPIPNGLLDAWGQYWYLDGGERLLNSYTAFEQRWFKIPHRNSDFAKPVPLHGAAEEIAQRVADITTVVRVEDYFDVAEANVIDRRIELPAKARKAYASMAALLRVEIVEGLEKKTITAHSAAGKVAKLLQISSGFAYWRDEDEDPDLQQCEELHTAKLDAVESILAETNEPLVVVYFHRATADQMRKRFKSRMVELDKAGKAQDAFNAGKVEILALQYRAGSTGLSLQHGGRNICLLAPTYAGDDYSQVIERLGPLRQMQSGYNRTVNVFRIIAEGTEDERVFAVAEGKIDMETAITRMIQGAR